MGRQIKRLSTVEVLQTINDGGTIEELSHRIANIVSLVTERGGTGKVTLTLIIKKVGKKQVNIADKISTVEPPIVAEPSIFFVADDSGSLSRQNPDQFAFDDSEVA